MQTCETCGSNWCQARQRCSNSGCVTRVVRVGFNEGELWSALRESEIWPTSGWEEARITWRTISEAERF